MVSLAGHHGEVTLHRLCKNRTATVWYEDFHRADFA
jgi:hypothetical protein